MFEFAVHFIFIEEALNGMVNRNNGLTEYQFLMSVYDTQADYLYNGYRYYIWNNNRFSWYTEAGDQAQLNDTSTKYCYIAF